MEIFVSFLIGDAELRRRCERLASEAYLRRLADLCGPTHSYEANTENRPDHAGELLAQWFGAPGRAVVVVSDLMADPPRGDPREAPIPTPWWQALVDASPEAQLGSVALTPWAPRRVPDVDRVVLPDFTPDALLDAITRAVRTLEYKQGPLPRPLQLETIKVRHVRTRDELRAYYQLRHRIYSVMGYFDHDVEAVPAGLEFDWYDQFSVPVGAFVEAGGGPPRMVGTTRLITTREYCPQHTSDTRKLAEGDTTGVLRRRFEETPAFEMPFLQSHPDNGIVGELQRNFPDAYCEVSRVIVDGDWRGQGISKVLVRYAMSVARWLGVRRAFLECLPTHRPLYEQFGFRVVPNRRQRVYNVNKTMELMAWAGPAAVVRRRPAAAEIGRLLRQGFLCLCHHADCPGGTPRYQLYGGSLCPLAGAAAQADELQLFRQWAGLEPYYEG
jgi:N-acetylglutamate synthase-like GNAT family acetyltransferase